MNVNVAKEVGIYIEKKMVEREEYLRKKGKIKDGRRLSRNYMAIEVLGVSNTWFSSIINGLKIPNDDLLLKISEYLEIDEVELFKTARRIPPSILEEFKKEFLGDYYIEDDDIVVDVDE